MQNTQIYFKDFQLSNELLEALDGMGFDKPTPIQAESIPLLLKGQDIIAQAQTGSGKTAAFLLPALQSLDLRAHGPQILVLCPTRELSQQVAREARKLGSRYAGLNVPLLCGGQPIRPQIDSLKANPHIVVGTPGRVLDLLDRGLLDLSRLRTLIFDEADKMFEMGFEDEVRYLLKNVPKQRQTVLFSATFPDAVKALSKSYQRSPVEVVVQGEQDNPDIEHLAFAVENEKKLNIFMRVLHQYEAPIAIVFCNLKSTVDEVCAELKDQGVPVGALHGDYEQRDRDRVMAMLRNHSYRILVCTDVAARGIDISNLDVVINYDIPHQAETYTHRIGRTGRAGRKGIAITLVEDREQDKFLQIQTQLQQEVERPLLGFKNQHGLGPSYKQSEMQTLQISGGRKNKVRPADILGALTGEAGQLQGADIGKIEIHDFHSYVAVKSGLAKTAELRLKNGKIKGQKFLVRLILD